MNGSNRMAHFFVKMPRKVAPFVLAWFVCPPWLSPSARIVFWESAMGWNVSNPIDKYEKAYGTVQYSTVWFHSFPIFYYKLSMGLATVHPQGANLGSIVRMYLGVGAFALCVCLKSGS